MLVKSNFPCLEHSNQMFLHTPYHDMRISATDSGVSLSANRSEREEWYVDGVPELTDNGQDDTVYYIKSKYNRGRFLCSNSQGNIFTSESVCEGSIWVMKESDYFAKGVFLTSQAYQRQLASDGRHLYTCEGQMRWETWILECPIGELCFMKSFSFGQYLSCDPFGRVEFKKNSDCWEVFRFTEVGDQHGSFIISSWKHFPKCLSSTPQGEVCMTDNLSGTSEKWILQKSENRNGVLIRSLLHGKYLSTTDCEVLSTNRTADTASIWTFDSAHKNIFHLYNSTQKKFVVNTKDSLYNSTCSKLAAAATGCSLGMNENCDQATKWEVMHDGCRNEVALRNMDTNEWLAIPKKGNIVYSLESQALTIKDSSPTGKKLVRDVDGSKTSGIGYFYLGGHDRTWEKLELHPVLPQLIQRPICAWES